ncbi:MAG: TolC family protein [Deltaproteobacteria bacterium]|jgi:cobalt-zinc-cadmium efflux system outer membrane protein
MVFTTMGAVVLAAVATSTPTLSRSALIARVVDQNPRLRASASAEARARFAADGADAWPDPMVAYRFSPPSIFDDRVRYGQAIDVQQRIPWFGKRGQMEAAARAEADGAKASTEALALDLALETSRLFDEVAYVTRAESIFGQHVELLETLRATADARYATGQALRQDVLRAEAALLHTRHRLIDLASQRAVLLARLDALMHRGPNAEALVLDGAPLAVLPGERSTAPELLRIDASLRMTSAQAESARLDYFPDLTVGGTYSSMWAQLSHRFMVGVGVQIPLALGRREAKEQEVAAEQQRLAEQRKAVEDDLAYALDAASTQMAAARRIVALYDGELLGLARERVAAAQSELESGLGSFAGVIDAQRELLTLSLERHRAEADMSIAAARAWRAAGMIPGAKE